MGNNTPIDISADSAYSSVYERYKANPDLIELCQFFQYKTANDADSPLSLKLDFLLSDDQKRYLMQRLLNSANASDCDFLFESSLLRNRIKEIRELGLSDNTLVCDKTKGFFKAKQKKNTDLQSPQNIDSLFKHIRNSFAHGRICFKEDYLILEDKVNELTARFVTTIQVLTAWKEIIITYLQEIEESEDELDE